MTGSGLFNAYKPDALHLELLTDQLIEIRALDKSIAPRRLGLSVWQAKLALQRLEYVRGKECNLPFIVRTIIKKAIATNTPPGHALHLFYRDDRMAVWWEIMVPEKIVPRRNEKMANVDH